MSFYHIILPLHFILVSNILLFFTLIQVYVQFEYSYKANYFIRAKEIKLIIINP